jgi:hypothetical protein
MTRLSIRWLSVLIVALTTCAWASASSPVHASVVERRVTTGDDCQWVVECPNCNGDGSSVPIVIGTYNTPAEAYRAAEAHNEATGHNSLATNTCE